MFEKEAEEYVRKIRYDVKNWDGAEPKERFYNEIKFKQAYLAGAEFGYNKAKEELERRIASQRGTIRVYNNKLKARLEQVERLKQENKKLIKAKEIIKEMLSILPKENIEGIYEITEEAEQFLKESE